MNWMLPLESVTCGVGPVITELPVCDRFTSLPGVARPSESFRVTVIVVGVMPSLRTLSGDALMLAEAGGGAEKAPPAVSANTIPSAVAVSVTGSATRSVTVNWTTPFAVFEIPLAGLIFAELPGLAASVTVLPLTALPIESRTMIETLSCADPSA